MHAQLEFRSRISQPTGCRRHTHMAPQQWRGHRAVHRHRRGRHRHLYRFKNRSAYRSLLHPLCRLQAVKSAAAHRSAFQGNAFNLGSGGEWFWEVDNVWSGAAQDYGTITSDFEGFSYTFENPDQLTDTVTIDWRSAGSNGCMPPLPPRLLVRPDFARTSATQLDALPLPYTSPINTPFPSIGTLVIRQSWTRKEPPATSTPPLATTSWSGKAPVSSAAPAAPLQPCEVFDTPNAIIRQKTRSARLSP